MRSMHGCQHKSSAETQRSEKQSSNSRRPRPEWNVCFPVTERGIPPYDAHKDRELRRSERERVAKSKLSVSSKTLSSRPTSSDAAGPASRGAVKLDVGKRPPWPAKKGKAGVSLQLVDDEAKGIEMNVIKRILEREHALVVLMNRLASEPNIPRKTAVQLLQEMKQHSLLTVEAISKWRACLPEPLPFIFENRNYLLRMMMDLSVLDENEKVRTAVAGHFKHDVNYFRFRGNPFYLPMDSNGGILSPLESISLLNAEVSQDAQDTSHIASLDVRRIDAAWHILVEEHMRARERYQRRQACQNDEEEARESPQPDFGKDELLTRNVKAKPGKLAPLPKPKTTGFSDCPVKKKKKQFKKVVSRECKCSEPKEPFSISAAITNPKELPPLTEADLHAFRHDTRSKLERMDADILASQQVVKTIQAAVDEVQGALQRLESKQSRPTLKPTAELESLRNKFQRLSKSLHYRRIELQRKQLARHCFVQDQAMRVDRAVKEQVERSLRAPMPNISTISESLQRPEAIRFIRLFARNYVEEGITLSIHRVLKRKAQIRSDRSEEITLQHSQKLSKDLVESQISDSFAANKDQDSPRTKNTTDYMQATIRRASFEVACLSVENVLQDGIQQVSQKQAASAVFVVQKSESVLAAVSSVQQALQNTLGTGSTDLTTDVDHRMAGIRRVSQNFVESIFPQLSPL